MEKRACSLHIDLSGIGDPIRRLVEGLIKLWRAFLYRKPEAFIVQIRALSVGLNAISQIHSLRKRGSLTDGEAAKLTGCVVERLEKILEAETPTAQLQNPPIVFSGRTLIERRGCRDAAADCEQDHALGLKPTTTNPMRNR
jgi:hypothetical protein